ncbi:MAG: glucosaminidase domain-containing protein [Paludibacteraceae bacterium]|nr:glucosaminidase domain-containing protein [Paludibacteraceae bacterium]
MRIKSFLSIVLLIYLLNADSLYSQSKNQAYINYIQNFHKLAMLQQAEHGIPASITLSQGLLESGAGQSELARKSNNHFGIKCHDWQGDKTYHNDDAQGECFRKYKHVLDSYEDHSTFLKTRARYAFLFQLSPTDYEAWAHGLKKAGYATDPSYAFKLISIIENYDLHQYDLHKIDVKQADHTNAQDFFSNNQIGTVTAYRTHQIYKNNRVKFVVSQVGDSYASLSEELNISEKRLRRYNEVNEFTELLPNTQVYLRYKKSKAARGYSHHVVKSGESMYSIAHNYGIKLEKLYKLNEMPYDKGAHLGQVLKLR